MWYCFSVSALLATCPELCIRHFMDFLPLLVWPSSTLTSGLAVVLADPCVVMPFGFGRFVPDSSFGASPSASMINVGRVVMLAVGLLFVLTWWGQCDSWRVLSWGCPYCSSLGVATLLPLVNFMETSSCSSVGWSDVW